MEDSNGKRADSDASIRTMCGPTGGVHAFFLTGVTFASWATRIPAMQTKLGLSPGELGVALLGTAAGELVFMNLAGYLAARFGSRSVTVIASVCLSALLPSHA